MFIFFLVISFLLTIFYVSIMLTYNNEWNEMEEVHMLSENPTTSVTIIIPARNEAANIGNLLQDIVHQIYPKDLVEIIVIDDFSEDATFEIVSNLKSELSNLNIYKLQDLIDANDIKSVYKKRAIEAAVKLAKGTLIITTDADCRLQQHWIHSIVSFYEKEKCALIAANPSAKRSAIVRSISAIICRSDAAAPCRRSAARARIQRRGARRRFPAMIARAPA